MFKHINIPIDRFVKNLPSIPAPDYFYSHFRLSLNDLDDDFVEWMEMMKLNPKVWVNPILFYAHPDSRTSVHTDMGGPLIWAMNIVLDGSTLEMQWRDTKSGQRKIEDLAYIRHDDNSPVIESTHISRTICRIGIPHMSKNDGEGKWLLSLRTNPTKWTEALKIFNN